MSLQIYSFSVHHGKATNCLFLFSWAENFIGFKFLKLWKLQLPKAIIQSDKIKSKGDKIEFQFYRWDESYLTALTRDGKNKLMWFLIAVNRKSQLSFHCRCVLCTVVSWLLYFVWIQKNSAHYPAWCLFSDFMNPVSAVHPNNRALTPGYDSAVSTSVIGSSDSCFWHSSCILWWLLGHEGNSWVESLDTV